MVSHIYSDLAAGGGMRSYLIHLARAQARQFSVRIYTARNSVEALPFCEVHGTDIDQEFAEIVSIGYPEIYHVHDEIPLRKLGAPLIRHVHNHNIYCPSGSRYLPASGVPCDRPYSIPGCLDGIYRQGCGSRHPQQVLEYLRRPVRELGLIRKFSIPLIANSAYVRDRLVAHGVSPNQVYLLPYGIPRPDPPVLPLQEAQHRQARLLFVGRIAPYKGLEWLLRALVEVDGRIGLDVVGDGWGRPVAEAQVLRLGLQDRVCFHGWCDGEALARHYQAAATVVFPSLWHEPAGLITLEAAAHGRPMIASAVGGIPEHLQDGVTGILVPPNDTEKLALAIARLAGDLDLACQMGRAAQALFAESFTIETHVQRLQNIYKIEVAKFKEHA